jgi:hypothetical protein
MPRIQRGQMEAVDAANVAVGSIASLPARAKIGFCLHHTKSDRIAAAPRNVAMCQKAASRLWFEMKEAALLGGPSFVFSWAFLVAPATPALSVFRQAKRDYYLLMHLKHFTGPRAGYIYFFVTGLPPFAPAAGGPALLPAEGLIWRCFRHARVVHFGGLVGLWLDPEP